MFQYILLFHLTVISIIPFILGPYYPKGYLRGYGYGGGYLGYGGLGYGGLGYGYGLGNGKGYGIGYGIGYKGKK